MRYPKLLTVGDTIGVCAPSSGIPDHLRPRLDRAVSNVESLGYKVIISDSIMGRTKCVSADAATRAAEFIKMYENPEVAAIIPPWGGEFLMDMLPLLDYEKLAALPAKWVCGYSDISTLTFVLTVKCEIAAVHGSNFMNMGYIRIHETDLLAFEAMGKSKIIQQSSPYWGKFRDWSDINGEVYSLTNESAWKSNADRHEFSGRMIGGCMDTICKLLGTKYAPVDEFLNKYRADGFIWTLESCEMNAGDIYRTLWQMRENGWFERCNGVIYGRADGYSDTHDFTLVDALNCLDLPVIYDADIGHIPPQVQIVNGAYGHVVYESGRAVITQEQII